MYSCIISVDDVDLFLTTYYPPNGQSEKKIIFDLCSAGVSPLSTEAGRGWRKAVIILGVLLGVTVLVVVVVVIVVTARRASRRLTSYNVYHLDHNRQAVSANLRGYYNTYQEA